MDFLDVDNKETEAIAQQTIAAYGYAPEHNFSWYLFCGGEYESSRRIAEKKERNVFVRFEEGFGLLTKEDKGGIYSVFSEPLAPPGHRASVLQEYAQYALQSLLAKKVVLDIESQTRENLLAILPSHLRALRPSLAYTLVSPVVNIDKFDYGLSGKRNKLLRYTKNRFFREHAVEIKDAREIEKNHLYDVVERWKKSRHAHGRVAAERYYGLIDSGFREMEHAVVFIVDGQPRGFYAGWPIPNTSSYYLGVVLHDYSFAEVGVLLYLDVLERLRTSAYTHVDLGGGDKPITDFKNQFQPESWYTTYAFSIVNA